MKIKTINKNQREGTLLSFFKRKKKFKSLNTIWGFLAITLASSILFSNCGKKAQSPPSDLTVSGHLESLNKVSASDSPLLAQEKNMISGKKAQIKEEKRLYHCPMHPNYIADRPGECAICGMNLVPIEKEKKEEEEKVTLPRGAITISPEKQKLLGVAFGQVAQRELHYLISAYGHFTYDETRLASVTTKFSGWIEKLFVDYVGKMVKRGDPLFSIYSPELMATQEEFLLALWAQKTFRSSENYPASGKPEGRENQISQDQREKEININFLNPSNLGKNQKEQTENSLRLNLNHSLASLVEASRRRLLLWDISQEQIERIEKEARPFRALTITSSVAGFVIEKNVVEGQFIMAGERLLSLADLSRIWLLANIYEQDFPFIHPGQEVEVEVSSFPGEIFRGRINYIYPYFEKENRSVKVRIEFSNPGYKFKPELYGRLKIHLKLGKRLSIPEDAVIETGERQIVFVVHEGRHFESREIKLGIKAGDFYEVLSGLEEGEPIVTSAQFLIDSESRLKAAIQGFHQPSEEKNPEKKEEKVQTQPAKPIH